jgi:phage-related tail fiber protein
VNFTAMAIGDGGGTLPVPDASQTKLVNEVWRNTLNKISQDNKNKNYVITELLIPPKPAVSGCAKWGSMTTPAR